MKAIRQVSSPIILSAAYGRSYSTAEAAMNDWNSGKDFKIAYGPYTSIRDLKTLQNDSSSIIIIDPLSRWNPIKVG